MTNEAGYTFGKKRTKEGPCCLKKMNVNKGRSGFSTLACVDAQNLTIYEGHNGI